jgi:uncharacterized protein YdeI (YjbR/CyaY-like superfamily)
MPISTGLRYQPAHRAGWRTWLRANHATSAGVWLVFLKGAARQISYEEAVEEALCFGWIDSLMRPIDARSYLQLFTPRKPNSNWSALNKRRVASLIERKRMAAPGLAKVEAAKQDGSWTKLDAVEAMIVPPDLARALAASRKAKAFFDALSPSSRKGILYWVTGVKTPELRAARVAHTVAQAAKGLRPAPHEAWLAKSKAAAKARKEV